MFLRQVDAQLLEDFSSIPAKRAEEGPVSIHDDETEFLIRFQQLAQCFRVELVVTEVQGRVDGFEGFKINVDFALFALGGDDFTTVHDQAIGGDLVVQLETLLRGGDGGQNRKSVDPGLDIGSSALVFRLVSDLDRAGVASGEALTNSSASILAALDT